MARFRPEPPPRDPEELPNYLEREMDRIANALEGIEEFRLPVLSRPPRRPRDGDIRYADGVNWNPGEGRGVYEYVNGSWDKL